MTESRPDGIMSHPLGPGAGLAARVRDMLIKRNGEINTALLSAARTVLTGERSGHFYTRNGITWQASSPGEPPAEATGALVQSWQPIAPLIESTSEGVTVTSSITSGVPYTRFFDPTLGGYQPSRLAPRPFVQAIVDIARPRIEQIMSRPWWEA